MKRELSFLAGNGNVNVLYILAEEGRPWLGITLEVPK